MTAPMPTTLNCHRASVVTTYDGDTFHARSEVLPNLFHEGRVRLARINAPELVTPAGKTAAAFTAAWLRGAPTPINLKLGFKLAAPSPFPLIVQILGLDNYGRLLTEVWRTVDGRNLSDDLLSSGNAVPYALKLQLAQ
jgi:endonuclease YncB( thermonuclease family)